MTFNEENVDDIVILGISGKLNTETSEDLHKKIANIIDNGTRLLVFDLSGVDYINSSGLRVLLTAAKKITNLSGKIVLTGTTELIYQVLHISGCTSHIEVYPSREEALKALKA